MHFICKHAGCYGASEFVYIMSVILTAKFVFAFPSGNTTLGKGKLIKSVNYVKIAFFQELLCLLISGAVIMLKRIVGPQFQHSKPGCPQVYSLARPLVKTGRSM